jgi:hypothetical protein
MKKLGLLLVVLGLGCSDAPLSGPEACVAAGGVCVLGNDFCSKPGPQDCNPDLNPGGAFCCLSCSTGDAGPECKPHF